MAAVETLRPQRKIHPHTTPPEVIERVIAFARINPMWGCCKLANELKHIGILLSSPTIQKILIRHHLGNRRDRAMASLNDRGVVDKTQSPRTEPA